MRTSFPYEHAGVLPEPELARLYREATVGVSLSLTNYSRVSQEMLACGLPCVELDTPSVRAALGGEDALTLAPGVYRGWSGDSAYQEPVTCRMKQGRIVSIEGGKEADMFRRVIEEEPRAIGRVTKSVELIGTERLASVAQPVRQRRVAADGDEGCCV